MKSKILKGHLQYIRGALEGQNELVKIILIANIKKKSKWASITNTYLYLLGLKIQEPEVKMKEEIAKYVKKNKQKNQDQWKTEVSSKKNLQIYKNSKQGMQEDLIYDNIPASVILFRTRSNSLHLEDRKRHIGKETLCHLCQKECEHIVHFVLKCAN